jgi:hypothetical protein
MFKFVSLITVAALSMTATVHAETASKFYGNIGYARTTLGSDNTFNAVSVGGGTHFNTYFGAEVEGAFGISETDLSGIDATAKLDYSAGAYLTGTYPVAPDFDLTGRIGYTKTQISAEYMGYKVSESDSGAAVGIGFRYFPKGGLNGVRGDLTYFELGDGNSNIAQIAYVRRF